MPIRTVFTETVCTNGEYSQNILGAQRNLGHANGAIKDGSAPNNNTDVRTHIKKVKGSMG